MKIIGLITEDFINYKKPSMYIAFPYCSFKCGREVCQNRALTKKEKKDVSVQKIIDLYLGNPISKAVVLGGLEPFDSWEDIQCFVMNLRYWTNDEVVIYTGYTEEEISDKIKWLEPYENIIVKFGRFIPNEDSHFDEILGVKLSSSNQYARELK